MNIFIRVLSFEYFSPFPDKLAPFPSGGSSWEGLPTNELVLEDSAGDKKNNILPCNFKITFTCSKSQFQRTST